MVDRSAASTALSPSAWGRLTTASWAAAGPSARRGCCGRSADGCEVRLLRSRLGLDSGYLSRLLRSLESAGLVNVAASPERQTVRVRASPPRAARSAPRSIARSDELAGSLLEPLNTSPSAPPAGGCHGRGLRLTDRRRAWRSRPVDPEHPDARYCLAEYVAELNRRSERGFDPSVGATALPHEVRPPAGRFFVAYLHGEAIGCGAVKHHAGAPSEIKRMWIAPAARGLGLGRRLLEAARGVRARQAARASRASRRAPSCTEALALYRSAGWVEVPPFNDEPFADHWFEKALA